MPFEFKRPVKSLDKKAYELVGHTSMDVRREIWAANTDLEATRRSVMFKISSTGAGEVAQ